MRRPRPRLSASPQQTAPPCWKPRTASAPMPGRFLPAQRLPAALRQVHSLYWQGGLCTGIFCEGTRPHRSRQGQCKEYRQPFLNLNISNPPLFHTIFCFPQICAKKQPLAARQAFSWFFFPRAGKRKRGAFCMLFLLYLPHALLSNRGHPRHTMLWGQADGPPVF